MDSSGFTSTRSPRGDRTVVCFRSPMQNGLDWIKRVLTGFGSGMVLGVGNNVDM